MGIKYLVQGAICACKYGSSTDELVVKTQNILYLNDCNSEKKLAATTTDIGATFKKNCFGGCAKKPHHAPCTVQVTQWSAEESTQKIEGAGNLLTELSKASCPIGGQDCIIVIHHGQQAEISQQNLDNTDKAVHKQINPFSTLKHPHRTLTLKAK